jgi:hypothetical protein
MEEIGSVTMISAKNLVGTMNVFPDPNAWEYFRWFSVNYLHRVSYCLLGK